MTTPRLPQPGGDAGNWGEVLNEFLRVEHTDDGKLKASGSLAGKYAKPADGIPKSDLHSSVQADLDKIDPIDTRVEAIESLQNNDGKFSTAAIADGAITSTQLAQDVIDTIEGGQTNVNAFIRRGPTVFQEGFVYPEAYDAVKEGDILYRSDSSRAVYTNGAWVTTAGTDTDIGWIEVGARSSSRYDNGPRGQYTIAIGDVASASGDQAVAIGNHTDARGEYSLATGNSASAVGTHSIALGYGATAMGFRSVAIGDGLFVTRDNTAAIRTSELIILPMGTNPSGIVLSSPNGTLWRVAVSDTGTLSTTAFTDTL